MARTKDILLQEIAEMTNLDQMVSFIDNLSNKEVNILDTVNLDKAFSHLYTESPQWF